MAYYKVLIEIWCDWGPEDSDLEEMVRHVLLGEDQDEVAVRASGSQSHQTSIRTL